MFDSGIKASDIIEQVKNEADIALSIDDKIYIQWLNAEEQILYTEFIREQSRTELNRTDFRLPKRVDSINHPTGTSALRFEDIYCVYADDTQLIKSTVASGLIFPNTFYKDGDNIVINLRSGFSPGKITIVFFVKPELKTASNINSTNVMVPVEFIDLVKCKLRGEAYKLANEDELAAKWLNDYNVLLEDFKAWVANKQANFGM